jgi:hypothetical protein
MRAMTPKARRIQLRKLNEAEAECSDDVDAAPLRGRDGGSEFRAGQEELGRRRTPAPSR